MNFINYAHRGASSYAPENTLAAFDLGLEMKANGMETDIQRTRDGILVLYHDSSLLRICGRPEAIHDLTYAELSELDFGIHMGEAFRGERIPTFRQFLERYAGRDIQFAIEIKEEGIEKEVLDLIFEYDCGERTIITSAIWQTLKNVRALDPKMRLGYLAKLLNDELLKAAKQCGIGQICPMAAILDKEWNQKLRQEGFSVRAWGIDSEETMVRMLGLKVDGMTVNFPDILSNALDRRCSPASHSFLHRF